MPHFLQAILESVSRWPDRPLFKHYTGHSEYHSWDTITYQGFADEIERVGSYWLQVLSSKGLKTQDVIGIWLTGYKHTDLLHFYGLSRAGYIPFSMAKVVSSQSVVKDLMAACNGKAVLFDEDLKLSPDPTFPPFIALPLFGDIPSLQTPLPSLPNVDDSEIAMYHHTSHSETCSVHSFLVDWRSNAMPYIWQSLNKGQPVFNSIGSFAHIGTGTAITYISLNGGCMIQKPSIEVTAESLTAMIHHAGLNCLFLYAPWLSKLLTIAKKDSSVLDMLRGMWQVTYTGAALHPNEEQWMVEQGIRVAVMYAATEIGVCLASDLSRPETLPAMQVIPASGCKLVPAHLEGSALDADSEKRSQGGKLFDMFLPIGARGCPHAQVRNRPNGHVSGDLFEEVYPDLYAFRGRNDDWIRTGPEQLFCDTKSVEESVLAASVGLITNCTVVGHYKPSIVVLAEPADAQLGVLNDKDAADWLKDEVLKLISPFNSRVFPHERIKDTDHIVFVKPNSLSRTMEKGNIRRNGVEKDYEEVLKGIYANDV